jgi:hypothetical protein
MAAIIEQVSLSSPPRDEEHRPATEQISFSLLQEATSKINL